MFKFPRKNKIITRKKEIKINQTTTFFHFHNLSFKQCNAWNMTVRIHRHVWPKVINRRYNNNFCNVERVQTITIASCCINIFSTKKMRKGKEECFWQFRVCSNFRTSVVHNAIRLNRIFYFYDLQMNKMVI